MSHTHDNKIHQAVSILFDTHCASPGDLILPCQEQSFRPADINHFNEASVKKLTKKSYLLPVRSSCSSKHWTTGTQGHAMQVQSS